MRWNMNEDKFNHLADIYEKYRPSYPEEYIKDIIIKCHLDSESLVADIGAGTGILTRRFLNNNIQIVGVEPNQDMRKILKRLEKNPNFRSIDGTAEHTKLKDNSIDRLNKSEVVLGDVLESLFNFWEFTQDEYSGDLIIISKELNKSV